MAGDDDLVRTASAAAAAAAERSRVELRALDQLEELAAVDELFAAIWGGAPAPMPANLLRALASAGSYLVGAFDRGGGATRPTMLAACVGFWGPPDQPGLHSHIAGVAPVARGRELGTALKLHQRADALRHGVRTITWTYDPLIARNAHFNLRKLGARASTYAVNYYGEMPDAINAGDETDRVVVHWELDSPTARAACDGAPAERPVADGFSPVLLVGPKQDPVMAEPAGDRVSVAVPPDAEGLRRADPAAAYAWRLAVRESLGGLMAGGARVVDFDRSGPGYLMQRGPS